MLLILGILALSLLMIVHEGGHYLVARACNMRVERFAIGIGPTIWRYQPRGSDTVFQVGLIPFMAYVQIAGQNPFEELEDDDEANFNNGTLFARISTIFAGPFANYLLASVMFFASALLAGKASTMVEVLPNRPAAEAGIQKGDRVVAIDGKPVEHWREIPPLIKDKGENAIRLDLERAGKKIQITATPREYEGRALLGISPQLVPMPISEAGALAIELPAKIVMANINIIGRMIAGKEKPQLSGPLGIMRESEKAAKNGIASYIFFIGFISTAVGFFNMLPFPALDGGRLMFLGYEGVTRRRPNQKVEAQIHTAGMILLLTTLVFVTYREWGTKKAPSTIAAEQEALEKKGPDARKSPSSKK